MFTSTHVEMLKTNGHPNSHGECKEEFCVGFFNRFSNNVDKFFARSFLSVLFGEENLVSRK